MTAKAIEFIKDEACDLRYSDTEFAVECLLELGATEAAIEVINNRLSSSYLPDYQPDVSRYIEANYRLVETLRELAGNRVAADQLWRMAQIHPYQSMRVAECLVNIGEREQALAILHLEAGQLKNENRATAINMLREFGEVAAADFYAGMAA